MSNAPQMNEDDTVVAKLITYDKLIIFEANHFAADRYICRLCYYAKPKDGNCVWLCKADTTTTSRLQRTNRCYICIANMKVFIFKRRHVHNYVQSKDEENIT